MQLNLGRFLKEVLILLLMVTLVSVVVNLYKTKDLVKGPAPDLQTTTITGMPVNLAETEKPVLIHFWATWCPICTLEHDSIESIARDYNVITIALNSGDVPELKQFMQDEQLQFPVVADVEGDIAASWSVKGVPSSFIISPGGQIAFIEVGYTSEIGLRSRLWWAGSQ